MEFFDSHAHYNDEKFETDREEILTKLYYEDKITKLTCVGYNISTSKLAIEISNQHDFILSTVGISPNDIEDYTCENLKDLKKLAVDNLNKVKAIGEIGLDYYWNKDNKIIQQELFIKQIEIANELNLPIVIHTRDAYVDTIKILKEHPAQKKGIFHCCPLNQELIKDGLKLGYYISFSGNITFKNAKSFDAVSLVPLDKILIETDSPYLTPEPYRGTRNDSSKVKLVAQKIADIKGISLEEVSEITYNNACCVFNI